MTYIPDHCPTVLGPGPEGFGEYHPAAIDLARGADVLIHDAQLFPDEIGEASFGHSVADYAIKLGERAGSRSVVLYHHRHTRTDDALDALAERVGAEAPNVSVAAEGTIIDI
jgi:ribonuclease BN (tRNA processing enzyme)